MSNVIDGRKDYDAVFRERRVREKALEFALDIRKFEIELYWKRATYFWALIAVSFTGYFVLLEARNDGGIGQGYVFLVACIGLVLSLGWYLANRGSKYWQENWERHVDALEDDIIGPLYRTTISRDLYDWRVPTDGWPFSVSKINQLISLFVVFVWIGLLANSLFYYLPAKCEVAVMLKYLTLTIATAGFCIWMMLTGSKRRADGRTVKFDKDELK